MPDHHHRSGSLRQTNKKNKRSKSSKRSLSRAAGGKINRTLPGNHKAVIAQSKADRRNKTQQRREAKKEELLRKRRGITGGPQAPPRVIGIISLGGSEEIEEKLRSAILEGADKTTSPLESNPQATITAKYDVHKKDGNVTVLTNSTAFRKQYGQDEGAAVLAALDLCRVCDMVAFVIDADESKLDNFFEITIGEDTSVKSNKSHQRQNWDHLISERGDRILSAIKGQGMPSLVTILAHTEVSETSNDYMSVKSFKSIRKAETKRTLNLRKYASRFAVTEFGPDNDKVIEVDLSYLNQDAEPMEGTDDAAIKRRTDVDALVRTLCTKAASPSKWVGEVPRPYVLSDNFKYVAEKQELKVSGYIRGKVPFCVNSLVHIPNIGTHACKSIQISDHPLARTKGSMDTSANAILKSDPTKRDSLEMFATPDALEGEQNLVGFDEHEDDNGMDNADGDNQGGFSRPAGWSDYQSAWLDAVDDIGADDNFDRGELARELNQKSSDRGSVAPDGMDIDDANEISPEEKRQLMEQRKKEQAEHRDFPDEVEVDEDENARDRYARYRSLKSFRKSYWDPKENLPESYGSVYHFANFKATQRSVMQEMKEVAEEAATSNGDFGPTNKQGTTGDVKMGDDSEDENLLEDCVPSGSYVTLTVEGVSPARIKAVSPDCLLAVVALLPHENKVSVLHTGLSQTAGCNADETMPVKSKDVLTIRCGWRTWQAKPVFSQNNLNCDKHKFERFMPQKGAFFAATFFGPVTYSPCPVLVFREREDRPRELVAVGSMIGADADRIVVKRVILTGYPVRVHKRHATVKYMFYNPEDVKWFKPAGLWTKHGLNGHIIESVGEHGTMKCLFNAPIKQHDTVCLPLYKRIFPKFAVPPTESGDDGATRGTVRARNALRVL